MSAELLEAVKSGDVDSARRILAAGADVNFRDGEGATILMVVSHVGNLTKEKQSIAIVGLDRVGSVFLEKLLGQSNNCPHDWALICPGYTPEQEP